jgi:hypothetical protein
MPGGTSGFVQLRRGLSEHVRDGRLSFFEASLYVFILMDTNPATGLCYGSAGLFSVIYGVPSRTCRDALEKLEEKGYLRRFPTRGKHGSYPILVNKFRCSDGAMKGKYVNCSKSIDYKCITYDIRDDSVDDSAVAGVNEDGNDSAGRVDTREKILDKNPSVKAKPSRGKVVDPRRKDFIEDLQIHWKGFAQTDFVFDAADGKQVDLFLKAWPKLTRKEWRNCLRNRRSSAGVIPTQRIHLWVSRLGEFLKSPLNEYKQPVNGTGGVYASVPTGKTDSNMGLCEEIIAEDQYRGSLSEDGIVQTGEAEQDGPPTLFEHPRTTGHASLSGGDGGLVGKPKGGWPDFLP